MTRVAAQRQRLGIEPAAARFHFRKMSTMTQTYSATAAVPTASGSRYLQQLCKHWAHNLRVEFTADHGTVVFPKDARGADHPDDALVTFDARADTLEVRIDASSPEQLNGLKRPVASHLDRFAFREAPLTFNWTDL